ncbi:hypothetical protein CERZMDRAFT_116845 [Cercospora zeae-maydis SCOH1-5]|uniref:Uncharacterized protein n=1 Tax=Cercospora zeae-maydis SCOH1-5 TaxID=717836 RepID=A0A6A6FMN0_9PEZI|nr:hypothetical protein CERZMDRAFT_116845 [Cercospora zeae-maydis SCOH1-5]
MMHGCSAAVMEGGKVSPNRPDSGSQRKMCLMPLHGSCCGLWRERCRGSRGQEDSGGDGERPECWRGAMSSWANDSGGGGGVVAGGSSSTDECLLGVMRGASVAWFRSVGKRGPLRRGGIRQSVAAAAAAAVWPGEACLAAAERVVREEHAPARQRSGGRRRGSEGVGQRTYSFAWWCTLVAQWRAAPNTSSLLCFVAHQHMDATPSHAYSTCAFHCPVGHEIPTGTSVERTRLTWRQGSIRPVTATSIVCGQVQEDVMRRR